MNLQHLFEAPRTKSRMVNSKLVDLTYDRRTNSFSRRDFTSMVIVPVVKEIIKQQPHITDFYSVNEIAEAVNEIIHLKKIQWEPLIDDTPLVKSTIHMVAQDTLVILSHNLSTASEV